MEDLVKLVEMEDDVGMIVTDILNENDKNPCLGVRPPVSAPAEVREMWYIWALYDTRREIDDILSGVAERGEYIPKNMRCVLDKFYELGVKIDATVGVRD